jgi:hypothetical protein
MILNIENPKEHTNELWDIIKELSNIKENEISIEKSIFYFYMLAMDISKMTIRKHFHL